ncbi:MAG: carbohydrate ABC transporter permease [Lachnospiraceae bacterium]|jgi:multiple sugar transport system permease protein|nr:carbohydrate ABC transporter permease [Lachnospiraceae bacterium]MCH4029709.1 carbohydrate ABC transporter permease [Lachnospiraceae bacterium]MCH4067439.1 carbohydrate ABC transporter permease [Lachnospiraceae bacterium]MCH4113463.1 carbohydrate ABC transporter permease [Lachnospiraceae bacterium]MCI1352779.1 carbohydrate ABC transporter permease [Lachnospiraceae bacterium]
MEEKKVKGRLGNLVPFILLCIFAVIYIFPILIMLSSSFRTNDQIFDTSLGLWPESFNLDNFTEVFDVMPFWKYFWNTMWVTGMNVLGTLVCTPMIAFSLSKIRWKGRDLYFSIIMASMMIPYTVTMIPLYRLWSKAGFVGTFWPLIIPAFFGYPFYIVILRQFMLTIPDELIEAGEIDGATRWQIYCKVILPLSKPGIATVTIFTFMSTFSDFLGPLLYANNSDHYTLSLGLYSFMNEHTVDWAGMMAAATLLMIPILIVFVFCQRYLMDGISTSGLKG